MRKTRDLKHMTDDELNAASAALRDEVHRREDVKRNAEGKALVGKFFKYRNCYSLPAKPSDYWWLYVRVESMSKGGTLAALTFQRDSDGKIEFARHDHWQRLDGHMSIPRREFNAAFKRMLTAARALGKA